MSPEVFKALREQAQTLFASQSARDKARVSVDAIFQALASEHVANVGNGGPQKVRKTSEEDAPAWFNDTLAKLRGTGEKFTTGRFLLLAGRFPATRSDSINVGRWLREAGITPRKTGGQMLFEV
jgi:hypothetical protein